MKVKFKRKAFKEQIVPQDEFVIEKVVEIPIKQFNKFLDDMLRNYKFIEEHKDLMYIDNNNVWHSILVTAKEVDFGILVQSEGYGYAIYSAYIRKDEVLCEGSEAEINEPLWFKPTYDEEYYFVSPRSYSCITRLIYHGTEFDERILETQKVFKNIDDAKNSVKLKKLEIKIKKRIAELNEGNEIPWWNPHVPKYTIALNSRGSLYVKINYSKQLSSDFYLLRLGDAQQLIDEMSKDLKFWLTYC